MNKQTLEYIRVREEIGKQLYTDDGNIAEWYWDKSDQREIYLTRADHLLSTEGIAILSDEQSLPEHCDGIYTGYETVIHRNILKANFKKVV